MLFKYQKIRELHEQAIKNHEEEILMETQTNAQTMYEAEKNSKFLKGVILGGIIGGALTLLDSSTRTRVKTTAVDLKDSSMDMITQVKENPGELKDQMVQRFRVASDTLKEAISEAQHLYEMVNNDVFGKVSEVKNISTEALSTAKEASGELKVIGSKVKDIGSKVVEAGSTAVSAGTTGSTTDTIISNNGTSGTAGSSSFSSAIGDATVNGSNSTSDPASFSGSSNLSNDSGRTDRSSEIDSVTTKNKSSKF
jgi:gas vesicle protein